MEAKTAFFVLAASGLISSFIMLSAVFSSGAAASGFASLEANASNGTATENTTANESAANFTVIQSELAAGEAQMIVFPVILTDPSAHFKWKDTGDVVTNFSLALDDTTRFNRTLEMHYFQVEQNGTWTPETAEINFDSPETYLLTFQRPLNDTQYVVLPPDQWHNESGTGPGCLAFWEQPYYINYCVQRCGQWQFACYNTQTTTYWKRRYQQQMTEMCGSCSSNQFNQDVWTNYYRADCEDPRCWLGNRYYGLVWPYGGGSYSFEYPAGGGLYCWFTSYQYCQYGCQNGQCLNQPACDPVQCNQNDYYGPWEYYCNGNQRWKHRIFYNYECVSDQCVLYSQNYVDDQFVENCPYGCANGQCNGAPQYPDLAISENDLWIEFLQ